MAHTTVPASTRDAARQLIDQGHSNRAVAARIGVSEATIRRWRGEWHRNDAPATRDDAPADAVTVPLDDDLRQALAVLAEAGYTPADAMTHAVALLADAYTIAWEYGIYPHGTAPEIRVRIKGLEPPPGFSW